MCVCVCVCVCVSVCLSVCLSVCMSVSVCARAHLCVGGGVSEWRGGECSCVFCACVRACVCSV